MASLVRLDPSTVRLASELLSAFAQVRDGIAVLNKYRGLMRESIASGNGGAANFAAVFGCGNDAEGQALADRCEALLYAYGDSNNTEYAKLRDLLNATIAT